MFFSWSFLPMAISLSFPSQFLHHFYIFYAPPTLIYTCFSPFHILHSTSQTYSLISSFSSSLLFPPSFDHLPSLCYSVLYCSLIVSPSHLFASTMQCHLDLPCSLMPTLSSYPFGTQFHWASTRRSLGLYLTLPLLPSFFPLLPCLIPLAAVAGSCETRGRKGIKVGKFRGKVPDIMIVPL